MRFHFDFIFKRNVPALRQSMWETLVGKLTCSEQRVYVATILIANDLASTNPMEYSDISPIIA